ncbi:unnamed protein product [Urochloa humidicola]
MHAKGRLSHFTHHRRAASGIPTLLLLAGLLLGRCYTVGRRRPCQQHPHHQISRLTSYSSSRMVQPAPPWPRGEQQCCGAMGTAQPADPSPPVADPAPTFGAWTSTPAAADSPPWNQPASDPAQAQPSRTMAPGQPSCITSPCPDPAVERRKGGRSSSSGSQSTGLHTGCRTGTRPGRPRSATGAPVRCAAHFRRS